MIIAYYYYFHPSRPSLPVCLRLLTLAKVIYPTASPPFNEAKTLASYPIDYLNDLVHLRDD